jgi:hypothetical protein
VNAHIPLSHLLARHTGAHQAKARGRGEEVSAAPRVGECVSHTALQHLSKLHPDDRVVNQALAERLPLVRIRKRLRTEHSYSANMPGSKGRYKLNRQKERLAPPTGSSMQSSESDPEGTPYAKRYSVPNNQTNSV